MTPTLTLDQMTALLARVPALLFNTADCTTDRVEGEERREPDLHEGESYKPGPNSDLAF